MDIVARYILDWILIIKKSMFTWKINQSAKPWKSPFIVFFIITVIASEKRRTSFPAANCRPNPFILFSWNPFMPCSCCLFPWAKRVQIDQCIHSGVTCSTVPNFGMDENGLTLSKRVITPHSLRRCLSCNQNYAINFRRNSFRTSLLLTGLSFTSKGKPLYNEIKPLFS